MLILAKLWLIISVTTLFFAYKTSNPITNLLYFSEANNTKYLIPS